MFNWELCQNWDRNPRPWQKHGCGIQEETVPQCWVGKAKRDFAGVGQISGWLDEHWPGLWGWTELSTHGIWVTWTKWVSTHLFENRLHPCQLPSGGRWFPQLHSQRLVGMCVVSMIITSLEKRIGRMMDFGPRAKRRMSGSSGSKHRDTDPQAATEAALINLAFLSAAAIL